jgi:hypothetical protein
MKTPESPAWLLLQGHKAGTREAHQLAVLQAQEALQRLRGDTKLPGEVLGEILELDESIALEVAAGVHDDRGLMDTLRIVRDTPGATRALAISAAIVTVKNFAGRGVMGFLLTPEAAALCGTAGGALFAASAPWAQNLAQSKPMKLLGNKPAVLFSSAMAFATTYQLGLGGTPAMTADLVAGPMGLMVPAEILPGTFRTAGLAATSIVDDISFRAALTGMPHLHSVAGVGGIVAIAAAGVASAIALQQFVPARDGRSLAEVQAAMDAPDVPAAPSGGPTFEEFFEQVEDWRRVEGRSPTFDEFFKEAAPSQATGKGILLDSSALQGGTAPRVGTSAATDSGFSGFFPVAPVMAPNAASKPIGVQWPDLAPPAYMPYAAAEVPPVPAPQFTTGVADAAAPSVPLADNSWWDWWKQPSAPSK